MNIECMVVGEFEVNCWIVWSARREAAVIDPGADWQRIRDFLVAKDLTVASYLLTHGHMDHVSALADLAEALPAPVGIHAADLAWAFSDENQWAPYYPVPRRPSQIQPLDDGQVWTADDMRFHVIATPGHTPGSVCLLCEESRALFSGDTLFAGSIGRTDFPGSSSRAMKQSLKRLATLDDDIAVYPGHGPKTTIGAEKRSNFFMRAPPPVG